MRTKSKCTLSVVSKANVNFDNFADLERQNDRADLQLASYSEATLTVTVVEQGQNRDEAIGLVIQGLKRDVKANTPIPYESVQSPMVAQEYMSKLTIVKMVREMSGMSLMQAKNFVEAYHDTPNMGVGSYLQGQGYQAKLLFAGYHQEPDYSAQG